MNRQTLLVALFATELAIVILAVQAVRGGAAVWTRGSSWGWSVPQGVPTMLALAAGQASSAKIILPGAALSLSPSLDDRVHVDASASDPQIHLQRDGEGIVIWRSGPHGTFGFHSHADHIDIKLPAKTRASIAESAGVEVEGMQADLSVRAANGTIRVRHVSAERVHLETANGRVYADDLDANQLSISSGYGRIVAGELVLRGNAPRLDAFTRDGRIDLTLKQLPADGTYMGHTDNGRMMLHLPTDSNVTVTLRTGHGKISAAGVTLSGEGHERRAVLGSGAATFAFSTGDGPIELTAGTSE